MALMKVEDTLNGNEGKGFVTINGKTRELFELLKIEANLELTVAERKVMGNRMVQHKVVGAKGTGSLTMYFNNSELLKLVQTYIKTGKQPKISIQAYNNDPSSSVGKNEVVLRDVIISNLLAIKLDADSEDALQHESDFTFDDIDSLQYFKNIQVK